MAEQRTLEAERAVLLAAVRKLVKAKGRFHTEQNYMAVVAASNAHDVAAAVAPPAMGEDGLPPLPSYDLGVDASDKWWCEESVLQAQRQAYDAGQQSQAARIQHLTHERDLALAAARQSAP